MSEWDVSRFFPQDEDAILAMEPADAGECVLAFIAAKPTVVAELLTPRGFGSRVRRSFSPQNRNAITKILDEGWAWLVRECLLVQDLGNPNDDVFVLSRRGRELAQSSDFDQFRIERALPRASLHGRIADRPYSDFLRGDYDGAAFKAMREVEIAIRDAAQLPNSLLGTRLARQAFHPESGALTDRDLEPSERQATADLFAGAIGLYKNPSSHRAVDLEAQTAAEVLQLASHLLRIIDQRREALR